MTIKIVILVIGFMGMTFSLLTTSDLLAVIAAFLWGAAIAINLINIFGQHIFKQPGKYR